METEPGIPTCVGFIMDGNRRWARARGLTPIEGHHAGYTALTHIIDAVYESGVSHMVCYAFSTENWKRSDEEVKGLMSLFRRALAEVTEAHSEKSVRFKFIGERERFETDLQEEMARIESARSDAALTVWIALSYGGRAEIVQAVNRAIVKGEQVTEESFEDFLWTSGMPDPDLIIRTSGEERLSNFLLWQSAYSELFFTKTLWPDFGESEFKSILDEYGNRQRRRGRNPNQDIPVLFEDNDVVVINKPSGIIVHNDGRGVDSTVVDWLLVRAPEARGVGEPGLAQDGTPLERSGVVHRLDAETSGVLILAKNQRSFEHLKHQFHDHLVRKEYRAFVYGTMKEKWGTIDRPIGRSTKDYRLRSAQRGARGTLRPAVTDWELIGQSNTHAYLKLMPKTGRTHQIRAHLKAIGRPIVQDSLYAPENLRMGENLGLTRLGLHAYMLKVVLPSGEEKTFLAPLPNDFEIASTTLATD